MVTEKKRTPIRFHVISLFPESIRPYLDSSILGRAQKSKLIHISFQDPKHFVDIPAKYNKKGEMIVLGDRVDAKPYGGGPGMVLRPEPILRAVKKALGAKKNARVIFFGTAGRQFDESLAKELSKEKDIVLLCGRYEGIDARVKEALGAEEVSVGPYVLTGGELPAATLIDCVARFIPGVLGSYESLERERASSPDVYTRPEQLTWGKKRYTVPPVLLTGNHAAIDQWRRDRRSNA